MTAKELDLQLLVQRKRACECLSCNALAVVAAFISWLLSSLAGSEVGLCSLGNTEVIHFFPEEGREQRGTPAGAVVPDGARSLRGARGGGGAWPGPGIPGTAPWVLEQPVPGWGARCRDCCLDKDFTV